MDRQNHFFTYLLQLADNDLILGHRLSEWCGHGPVLEQDIALTNISLDLIGQARNLYQLAARIEDADRTEDDLAYLRTERAYRNVLLTEQSNGDFGKTIIRHLFFDHFHILLLQKLLNSSDEALREIAEKSIKEIQYHVRFSSEWTIRLGDGTEESHRRMQDAVDELWMYTGEMFNPSEADEAMAEHNVAPSLTTVYPIWKDRIEHVLKEATLEIPEAKWFQKGGKQGMHSEQMGFILTELQYIQRAYPGVEW